MFNSRISPTASVFLIVLSVGPLVRFTQAQINPAAQPSRSINTDQLPAIRPDYVLGPNDQILIRSPQTDQINERPFRIDADGFISLPIVGRVRANGLSIQALEADLMKRLGEYVR